jgi:hypothetical protein
LRKAREDDTQLMYWYAHSYEMHAGRAVLELRAVTGVVTPQLQIDVLARLNACRLVEVSTSSDVKRRTAIILPWDVKRKGAGPSGGKLLQLALFNDTIVHWSRIEVTTNSALRLPSSTVQQLTDGRYSHARHFAAHRHARPGTDPGAA